MGAGSLPSMATTASCFSSKTVQNVGLISSCLQDSEKEVLVLRIAVLDGLIICFWFCKQEKHTAAIQTGNGLCRTWKRRCSFCGRALLDLAAVQR